MSNFPLDHPTEAVIMDHWCPDCDDVTKHEIVDQRVMNDREHTERCTRCGNIQCRDRYQPQIENLPPQE